MTEEVRPFVEEPVPDGYREILRLRAVGNDAGDCQTDLQVKHMTPGQVITLLRILADDLEKTGGYCDCGRPECEERRNAAR